MSIVQTLLVFVGIPAAVFVIVTGLVYSGSATRARRYRPGRPFEFAPVWFLAAPDRVQGEDPRPNGRAVGGGKDGTAVAGADRLALTKAGAQTGGAQTGGAEVAPASVASAPQDATGGTSDRW